MDSMNEPCQRCQRIATLETEYAVAYQHNMALMWKEYHLITQCPPQFSWQKWAHDRYQAWDDVQEKERKVHHMWAEIWNLPFSHF